MKSFEGTLDKISVGPSELNPEYIHVFLLNIQSISRFGRHILMLKSRWQAQNQLVEACYILILQVISLIVHKFEKEVAKRDI